MARFPPKAGLPAPLLLRLLIEPDELIAYLSLQNIFPLVVKKKLAAELTCQLINYIPLYIRVSN
jgi:hypothetical protein